MNDKEAKDNFWHEIAEIFVSSNPHSTGRKIRALVKICCFVEIEWSGGGCAFLKTVVEVWDDVLCPGLQILVCLHSVVYNFGSETVLWYHIDSIFQVIEP